MSTKNKAVDSAIEETPIQVMESNSPVEFDYFSAAIMGVLPEDKKGNAEVAKSMRVLYDSYFTVANATRTLAIAVFDFCSVSGLTYDEVGSALSKGLQKQLSRGYISKLYHAGKALRSTPVAHKITDIDKLANLGKLQPEVLKQSLEDRGGVAWIGKEPVTLMKRERVANMVSEMLGDEPKTRAPWNHKALQAHVETAIKESGNQTLIAQLHGVLETLNAISSQAESAKKAASAERKASAAEAKAREIRASISAA